MNKETKIVLDILTKNYKNIIVVTNEYNLIKLREGVFSLLAKICSFELNYLHNKIAFGDKRIVFLSKKNLGDNLRGYRGDVVYYDNVNITKDIKDIIFPLLATCNVELQQSLYDYNIEYGNYFDYLIQDKIIDLSFYN